MSQGDIKNAEAIKIKASRMPAFYAQ